MHFDLARCNQIQRPGRVAFVDNRRLGGHPSPPEPLGKCGRSLRGQAREQRDFLKISVSWLMVRFSTSLISTDSNFGLAVAVKGGPGTVGGVASDRDLDQGRARLTLGGVERNPAAI